MNYTQKELTHADVEAATARNRQKIDFLRAELERLIMDPQRDDRRKAQECVACFYTSHIGGATITSSNCRVCNAETQFGSTAVDALCERCAKQLKLCKHCGADVELHRRRKVDIAAIEKIRPFPMPESSKSWLSPVLLPCRPKEQP